MHNVKTELSGNILLKAETSGNINLNLRSQGTFSWKRSIFLGYSILCFPLSNVTFRTYTKKKLSGSMFQ